jgi:hypothetical protein
MNHLITKQEGDELTLTLLLALITLILIIAKG